MLEREFAYYREHQDELVKEYKGKYIIIIGEEVVDSFDGDMEAYFETAKIHPVGTFLIQHCIPGKESYTITFYGDRFLDMGAEKEDTRH